jgi:NAD(P)-dependent dehydrogenase (short-subunit alcohol dehydrogenase family)
LVTQALFLTARQGGESRIVNITSDLGSLNDGFTPRELRIRNEQAALNMLTRKLAAELGSQNTVVIALLEAVRTDMGGP